MQTEASYFHNLEDGGHLLITYCNHMENDYQDVTAFQRHSRAGGGGSSVGRLATALVLWMALMGLLLFAARVGVGI